MAISKNGGHGNDNKMRPEPVKEEVRCDSHRHEHNHNHLHLWDDFIEAKKAVYDVRLKSGEVHTEFYKDSTGYHCVVGVGNYDVDKYPLLLTDSGADMAIQEQIKGLNEKIASQKKALSVSETALQAQIDELVSAFTASASDIASIKNTIDDFNRDLGDAISKANDAIAKNKRSIDAINDKIASIISVDQKQSSDISSFKSSVNALAAKVGDITKALDTLKGNDAKAVEQIGAVKKDVTALRSAVKTLSASLDSLNKTDDDIYANIETFTRSFDDVYDRLSKCESATATLGNSVSKLSESTAKNFDGVAKDIANVVSSVTALKKTLSNSIKSVNESITANANDIAELRDKLGRIDINGIEDKVADVSKRLRRLADEYSKTKVSVSAIESHISKTDTSIAVIAEDVRGLKASASKLPKMSEDIAKLKVSVTEMDKRNASDFKAVNARVDGVNDKVTTINERLKALKDRLDKNAKADADRDAVLKALVKRVDTNTENIASADREIDALNGKYDALHDTCMTIVSRLDAMDATDASMAEAIGGLRNDVSAIASDIEGIKASVTEHDGRMDLMTGDIERLASTISGVESLIESGLLDASVRMDTIEASLASLASADEEATREFVRIDGILAEHGDEIEGIKLDVSLLRDAIDANATAIEEQHKVDELFEVCVNVIQDTLVDVSLTLDDLGRKVDENAEGLVDVSLAVDQLSERMDAMEGCCADVHDALDGIRIDVSSLSERIDASLEGIATRIGSMTENLIDDSSIDSLFSDDILTLNLCCYTPAGHVEVYPYDAEDNGLRYTEWLYDASYLNRRDDGKVPYGEYRTYVSGERITLNAVHNKGYFFKEWLLNAKSIGHASPRLDLTFTDSDYNVIPSLWDGIDHDPILGGYTALYGKLFKLTTDVSLLNYVEADVKSGDRIDVIGCYDTSCTEFAKGSTLTFDAVPVNDTHKFEYYIVDPSTRIDRSHYMTSNVVNDYHITAFFSEIRYVLHDEPNKSEWGNIKETTTFDSYESTYVKGAKVVLEAVPAEGYRFVRWVHGEGSALAAGQIYKIHGVDAVEPKITLIIDQDIYITAEFAEEE